VEIIANGGGLDLVRTDGAPQGQRMSALLRDHNNVSVLACRKALERLSYFKGVDAELLDGVSIAPSALEQILMRMRQGWLFISASSLCLIREDGPARIFRAGPQPALRRPCEQVSAGLL
jgi:intracellular sulfur oxidation DsrE/DsrF family protein